MNEQKKILLYVNFLRNEERRKQQAEREKNERRKKNKARKTIAEQNKNKKTIPFIEYTCSPKYSLNLASYYTRLYLLEYFKLAEIREKNRNF